MSFDDVIGHIIIEKKNRNQIKIIKTKEISSKANFVKVQNINKKNFKKKYGHPNAKPKIINPIFKRKGKGIMPPNVGTEKEMTNLLN